MSNFEALRLPTHHGPAAWNAILGTQEDPLRLTSDRSADIVIVGAGFAGLSAARRLQQLQPGIDVAVLEAGRLAEGACGRNSGFMIDLPHDLASGNYAGTGTASDTKLIELNRQAIAFARAAVQDYGIDGNYFDECGKINGATGKIADAHNQSYAQHLDRLGERHEWLDAARMQEITGSHHYCSGLYTPGTVMLQPAGYIRGLATGLRRNGVAIHENSPAIALRRTGDHWQVATPEGIVDTTAIILANNGHLESFGFERGRLMHLYLFASMTQELNAQQVDRLGGQPRWGITPSDPMGTTMRRIDTGQGGNRIVTRTCALLRQDMAARSTDVEQSARTHVRKFRQRFPQLAEVSQQYSWAGQLCLTLNGVSVMRELDDRLYAACVQNGLGTARGTLTGIGAAELAMGEQSAISHHFTAEARPRRLPPKPFASLGANAWMRFRQWRAAEE